MRLTRSSRAMIFAALVLGAALPLALCAAAEEPAPKAAVPGEEVLAETSKKVSEIYKTSLAAAKAPEAKVKLAAKLLQDGIDTRDDAAARFVLYRAARKLASGGGDVNLALRIAEQMGTDFAMDAGALQVETLTETAPQAKSPEDIYTVVRTANRYARAAAAADHYASAVPLAKVALDAGRKMKDADIVKQCEAEVKRLTKAGEQYTAAKPALAQLEADPTNAAANAAAGRYYCFVQGNFAKGMPMLALGDDAALKDLAGRDLQNPQEAPAQMALGDAWYELAQKQDAALQAGLLSRAGYWYRLSPLGATGLAKVKIDKRLAEISAATSPFHVGEWVELLDYTDLKRDVLAGPWEWKGTTLVLPAQPNSGMCYLPVVVDGSFELRLRITADRKEILGMTLPFPGHEATLHMNARDRGDMVCGIWSIDGRGGDANPSRGGAVPTTPGVPFTADLRVEKKGEQAAISASYEGKRCCSWQGSIASLDRWWKYDMRKQQMLIGADTAKYQIHSARFRLLSGSARLPD